MFVQPPSGQELSATGPSYVPSNVGVTRLPSAATGGSAILPGGSQTDSIYTTIGEPSSKFDEFLAARSQFDSDHDQIWPACADRSGNGSYLNKLAWKGGLIGAILRTET